MIGHAVILEVAPHILDRIEFGCVGRQPFDRESRVDRPPILELFAAMGVESIPHENDVSSKMAEQIVQEGNDLGRADVLIRMPMQIEPEAAAADLTPKNEARLRIESRGFWV